MQYLGIDLHRKQMTVSLRNPMAMSSFVARSAHAGPNWRSFAINYTRPWPTGRSMWRSSKCADFTIGWCNGSTGMNGVTRCW